MINDYPDDIGQLHVGDHVTCGVAPGWIFAGEVIRISPENDYFVLRAIWIENVRAPWPEAVMDRKKVKTSSKIKWLRIQVSALLYVAEALPSVIDMKEISAVEEVE